MIQLLLELIGSAPGGSNRGSLMLFAVAAALLWAVMFDSLGGWIFFGCVAAFAVLRWVRFAGDAPVDREPR